MKSVALLRNFWLASVLGTSAIVHFTPVMAKEVVSQKMAVPLKKVELFMKQGKIAQANEALKDAQKLPNPSVYEQNLIQRLQIALAVKQNDLDTAFKGYDQLIASHQTSKAEKIQMRMAQASLAYRARNYPQAIRYIQSYFAEGGTNTHMTTLLIQSYFLNNNYKEALQAQQKQIDEELRNNQIPAESQWQIMANCQEKLGDQEGLRHSYIQLATHYSKPEYWSHVMAALTSSQHLTPAMYMEILRFRLETGLMKSSDEYMEMAEIAMQAGTPHLALKTLNEGYKKGILGADKNTARVLRLRKFIQNNIQKEQPALSAKIASEKKATDGDNLLMLGYDLMEAGRKQEGFALMQAAMQKPFKNRDEALLHFAMGELGLKQNKQAIVTLKTLQGNGIAKEIADLWLMKLQVK